MTHFVEFPVISNQATNEIRSQEFIFKIVDIPEIMYCLDTQIDGFNQANFYLNFYEFVKNWKKIYSYIYIYSFLKILTMRKITCYIIHIFCNNNVIQKLRARPSISISSKKEDFEN